MKTFGRYQLLRRIAAGGMAEVFLATGPNPLGQELIAVKLIHAHIAQDPGFMAMFLDEARLTAPLSHPNLVHIFDLGHVEERLFLAMEFIRGHPLNLVLKKAETQGQGVGAARAAAIVQQAALGLHHAHEALSPRGEPLGLVHRDVSPQNLMLDLDGRVKVVDFGVAKAQGRLATSQKGSLKGKAGYSAPEQLRNQPTDRRADVFALGSVLFELATGEPLFAGRSEAEILQRMLFEPLRDLYAVSALPRGLAEIIATAVAKRPDDRFETALALADSLDDFLGPTGPDQPQLAQLMGALFAPMPRTVAEANADTLLPALRTGHEIPRTRPPEDTPPTQIEQSAVPSRRLESPPARSPSGARDPLRDTQPARPGLMPELESGTVGAGLPFESSFHTDPASAPLRAPERSGPHRRPPPSRVVPRRATPAPPVDDEATSLDASDSTQTETQPTRAPRRPVKARSSTWRWVLMGGALGAGVLLTAAWVLRPAGAHRPAAAQPERVAPVHVDVAPAAPQPGSLTVLSARPTHVVLDGQALGVTPLHRRPVAPGPHTLKLTRGHAHRTIALSIESGKETVQQVELGR